MVTDEDLTYLRKAIENSQKSFKRGNFPAGAIVVKDGKILSSSVSSPYPGLLHADSKAVFAAFKKNHGPIKEATLYIGLASCLMCLGVAYWAGIRRIVFAIPKNKVSGDYYETGADTSNLISTFNEKIELINVPELENEALEIVRTWERKMVDAKSK